MKKLFEFYIYNHIHVGLSAVSLYMLYSLLTGQIPDSHYAVFLFSATVSYYTFLRLIHRNTLRFPLAKWYHDHYRLSLTVWILSTLTGFYLFSQFGRPLMTRLIIVGIPAILYNLRANGKKIYSLRKIGLVKIFLISFVWAAMVVWVPFSTKISSFTLLAILTWHAFFFVLLWTLPFDIRDLALDQTSLKTLPQIFKEKIKYIALLIWGVFSGLNVFLLQFEIETKLVWAFILAASVLLWMTFRSEKYRDNYFFTAFWAESVPIFTLLLVWVVQYLN